MNLILLLSSILFAGTTNFCFDRSLNLENIRKDLLSIAAPSDQIDLRRGPHCIEVTVSEVRAPLFEKYLRRHYQGQVRVGESLFSNEVSVDNYESQNCRLEVETIVNGSETSDEYSAGSKNRARRTENTVSSSSKSQMLLGKGRSGKLTVNERIVEIFCSPRGSRYQLDIKVVQANGAVETSLTVSRDEKVDIGNIVDQFEKNGRLLDINSGAGFNKSKGQSNTQYFVTVK